MFPWGALIGLAGQAVSGVLSTINNKSMQRSADAEAARQAAAYEAKANEDPLARSENQQVIGEYDRQSRQQIDNARNIAAITGATPEYGLAVQKGVAEGRANLMGQIAGGASARKDRYDLIAENVRHQKALEDQERRMQRNNTYAALAGNAASAVGAIMEGYSAPKAKAASGTVNNDAIQKTGMAVISSKPLTNPNSGMIPNADGTFTKDGVKYAKNPDGTFKLIF